MRLLLLILASALGAHAAIYEEFPGFKNLFERADFVGIVKLGARDVPTNPRLRASDWVGPHRFFRIESEVVLKGDKISGDVARLADRRLGTWGESVLSIRNQEILVTDGLFLVFMHGRNESESARYQWDEIHAEGAVLPVSPKSNLNNLQYGSEDPLVKIDTIIQDYTDFCRQFFEQAVIQATLIEQQSEQAGAGQPATRSESNSEGDDKPQPESEGRFR